jgi:hypothetical protein
MVKFLKSAFSWRTRTLDVSLFKTKETPQSLAFKKNAVRQLWGGCRQIQQIQTEIVFIHHCRNEIEGIGRAELRRIGGYQLQNDIFDSITLIKLGRL